MLEVVECLKMVWKMFQEFLVWNWLWWRSEDKLENVFVSEEKEENINVRIVRGGSKKKMSKVFSVMIEDDIVLEKVVFLVQFCCWNCVLRLRLVGVMGGVRVGLVLIDVVGDNMLVIMIRVLVEWERVVMMKLSKLRLVGIVCSYKMVLLKFY